MHILTTSQGWLRTMGSQEGEEANLVHQAHGQPHEGWSLALWTPLSEGRPMCL